MAIDRKKILQEQATDAGVVVETMGNSADDFDAEPCVRYLQDNRDALIQQAIAFHHELVAYRKKRAGT